MTTPRHRLAVDAPLAAGATVVLEGNPAHYLSHVVRLSAGDAVTLFNRTDGEWRATISVIRKKMVELQVTLCLRPPSARGSFDLIVCFAPIKGGRLETMIEKATELGATVLQPVITQRTIVGKVNRARAEAIAREAAEQCERIDWPEIREPVTLEKLLSEWPVDIALIYGDETGAGVAVTELLSGARVAVGGQTEIFLHASSLAGEVRRGGVETGIASPNTPPPHPSPARGEGFYRQWAILTGPEGGFTPEELAMLMRVPAAKGVGLGPRILRADTAIIALCALTLAVFGDWHLSPRFVDS